MTDVILLTMDAFRFDILSTAGGDTGTTPFLDSLADEGLFFSNHYSTGSGTSSSFPGIHASSLPLDHGYAGLGDEHVSLAEVLQSVGVQTVGITAQTSCSSIFGYDRGFNVFQDWVEADQLESDVDGQAAEPGHRSIQEKVVDGIRGTPVLHPLCVRAVRTLKQFRSRFSEESCPYRRATEVTDTALSILSDEIDPTAPYFAWIHYMEPHAPYYPPREYIEPFHDGDWTTEQVNAIIKKIYRTRSGAPDHTMAEKLTDGEIAVIEDFYRAASAYVDNEIERLFEGLDNAGLLDDTVVFISADHGEELFDHGNFGHRPKMYEELVHVPLICYTNGDSGFRQREKCSSLTSHLDIAPTIVDFYDGEQPESWRGQSLAEYVTGYTGEVPRETIFAELCHMSGLGGSIDLDKFVGTVRYGKWKYIHNSQSESEELYDLERDPGETENRYGIDEEIAEILNSKLFTRLDTVTEAKRSVDVSQRAQDRLESLGYKQ